MKLEINIETDYNMGLIVTIGDKYGGSQEVLRVTPSDKADQLDPNLVSATINYGKRKFMEKLKEEKQ